MDELELRIAALETAFIELGAWIDPQALDDAAHAVREALGRGDADEDAIRLGAIQLLTDARNRFAGPSPGVAIKATPSPSGKRL